MIRLAPSIVAARLRAAAIGASLVAPIALYQPAPVMAQEQQADPLQQEVEDFWHFGKVARYDVAVADANKILQSGADPVKILTTFEKVTSDRGDNLDEWLVRWQGVDEMKDVTKQLVDVLNKGRYTRRADPAYIEKNISRLGGGDRPYRLAMVQLRESGELAVPLLLDTLKDPSKQDLFGPARRAIIDLGRYALNPLVAATETNDPGQQQLVASLLGDLGYDSAAPYLSRLADSGANDDVKSTAKKALSQINAPSDSTADQFYDLAEKLYYGKSSLVADERFPMANVWRFEQGKGLIRTPVPASIFNDVMSMRASEYALQLNTKDDALSLWVVANFKREIDLPSGSKDDTRPTNAPDAHYYGVTAGTQYLNAALSRTLKDHNSAVALAVVKALQEIVGDSNFKSGGSPLIDAMQYPDRRVRFEAAFSVAQALPQSSFAGQDLVVPLLAEAISQTGQPSVLVVMPTQEAVNGIVQPLKGDGYIAAGATNASGALAAAASVPAVDVVLISEDLPPAEIETLLGMVAQSPKLRTAGKLVVVHSNASPWEARKATDPTISTTTTTDPAALKTAITSARDASGALPLDPAMATDYATRAGNLIKKLAISRGQVLDLAPARSTLLGALEDSRPEIVKLAGEGLALLNNDDAQKGILLKATTDGTADDVKISLFKSLATSAKFFGNKLDAGQVESLDHVVGEAKTPEVQSAAAEARGALNLPSDIAKKLILDQAAH